MCRYCEKPEPITNKSNCPTGIFIDKNVFKKDGGFLLKIVSDVSFGVDWIFHVLTSIKINYCPICGRKLEDTENA